MGKAEIKVIHLDSEKSWRGGQQQAAYLFSAMIEQKIPSLFICQPFSQLQNYCLKSDLPCRTVTMLGECDLLAGFKIARIARNGCYNIIHAHSAHALAIALWVKLFYPEIKVVGTRRVDFHLRKNPLSKLKYRTNNVGKIVCVSREIEQILIKDKISPNKLITIHSGIDIHKFDNTEPLVDFRKKYAIPSKNIIVGTVAALVGHKDYPTLLKAAKYVIRKYNDVTFATIGSGHDEQKIKNLHQELELEDQFIFLGFQQNVGAYLKNFDIFVLSSQKEGLGSSILEAQAAGLPVIGTTAGGIPEIISHRRNGLLVPPQDHEKLGEAILELIINESLRSELSRNALDDLIQFDINKTIKKYLELYEQMLE